MVEIELKGTASCCPPQPSSLRECPRKKMVRFRETVSALLIPNRSTHSFEIKRSLWQDQDEVRRNLRKYELEMKKDHRYLFPREYHYHHKLALPPPNLPRPVPKRPMFHSLLDSQSDFDPYAVRPSAPDPFITLGDESDTAHHEDHRRPCHCVS